MEQLEILKQIAHGIALHFGPDCEVVIHDLRTNDPEQSIVYIENGQISGRKIGDGPSSVVLKALHSDSDSLSDHLAYLTKTSDGKYLKSSTIFIRNTENIVHYILGINYDITKLSLINDAVLHLISSSQPPMEATPIPNNVNELLDELLVEAEKRIGKPAALMSKAEKVEAIQFLNNAGAFLITKSGDKISKYFGISKYTLYSYIDAKK